MWSGIRQKLENDYLAASLRGHIQYYAISYSKSPDHNGRAVIRLDGKEIIRRLLTMKAHIQNECETIQLFFSIRAKAENII